MNDLLDYILEQENIFKPVSSEEIPVRRREALKSMFNNVKITKNDDGTVDIGGYLDLGRLGLTSLLDLPYKIRKVTGYFDCSGNQLITLEGAPTEVNGDFNCFRNELTTLKGAPKKVTISFCCGSNYLTSLKGAPDYVGGDFSCNDNLLVSLEGAPRIVGGYFSCRDNNLPKNVEIPSKVKGIIFR